MTSTEEWLETQACHAVAAHHASHVPTVLSRPTKALGWSEIAVVSKPQTLIFLQDKSLGFRFTKKNSKDFYSSPLDHSYSYGPSANSTFSLNSMTAVLNHGAFRAPGSLFLIISISST